MKKTINLKLVTCIVLIMLNIALNSCSNVIEGRKVEIHQNIKILFENEIVQDDLFDFSTFQEKIFDPRYTVVKRGVNKMIMKDKWYVFHEEIISKFEEKGEVISIKKGHNQSYGHYKIYLISPDNRILLINNKNEIYYCKNDSIIRFNDKEFGDKIRSFIDYYTYFIEKDLEELSGSKNYFKTHQYLPKKLEEEKPFLYYEVDVSHNSISSK